MSLPYRSDVLLKWSVRIGILLAASYSFMMVSTGIFISKYIPANIFMSDEVVAYIATLLLEVGKLCALISIVTYSRPWRSVRIVFADLTLSFLLLSILLVTTMFSIAGVTYSAYSELLLGRKVLEAEKISSAIDRLGTDTKSIYVAYLNSRSRLIKDTAAGNDESGVAICGSLCKQYRRQLRITKDKYDHLLLSTLNASASPITKSNIDAAAAHIENRLTAIGTKIDYFRSWAQHADVSVDNIKKRYEQLEKRFDLLYRNKQLIIDKKELAKDYAIRGILSLFRGAADFEFLLRLAVTLIPESITLTLLLAVGRFENHIGANEITDLKAEVKSEKDKAKLRKRVAEARKTQLEAAVERAVHDARLQAIERQANQHSTPKCAPQYEKYNLI